jgi:hypothetical protein
VADLPRVFNATSRKPQLFWINLSGLDVDQSCARAWFLGSHQMRLTTKNVIARDVEQARQDVAGANTYSKKASDRSDALSAIDKDLLGRSRRRIASFRFRLQQKQGNAFRPYPVDSKMLERHLQRAERHVAVAQEHVRRQRERVAKLERDGHDASAAGTLLAQFEELEIMHIAHRDRLARQLGKVA